MQRGRCEIETIRFANTISVWIESESRLTRLALFSAFGKSPDFCPQRFRFTPGPLLGDLARFWIEQRDLSAKRRDLPDRAAKRTEPCHPIASPDRCSAPGT